MSNIIICLVSLKLKDIQRLAEYLQVRQWFHNRVRLQYYFVHFFVYGCSHMLVWNSISISQQRIWSILTDFTSHSAVIALSALLSGGPVERGDGEEEAGRPPGEHVHPHTLLSRHTEGETLLSPSARGFWRSSDVGGRSTAVYCVFAPRHRWKVSVCRPVCASATCGLLLPVCAAKEEGQLSLSYRKGASDSTYHRCLICLSLASLLASLLWMKGEREYFPIFAGCQIWTSEDLKIKMFVSFTLFMLFIHNGFSSRYVIISKHIGLLDLITSPRRCCKFLSMHQSAGTCCHRLWCINRYVFPLKVVAAPSVTRFLSNPHRLAAVKTCWETRSRLWRHSCKSASR